MQYILSKVFTDNVLFFVERMKWELNHELSD